MSKLMIGMVLMLVLATACSPREQVPVAPAEGQATATVVQDADTAIAAVDEADALADIEAEQELDDLEAVLDQVPS
ncbi:MAG TPA: hypothetical protein VJC16_06485 [Candidatus Nanoarchaeia archaeon]|nr:hypothetical protein [Candidatus Nanoarchaeia archaeon]